MGPRRAASVSPGDLLDTRVLRPTPALLSQKLWGWAPQPAFNTPPGDAGAGLSGRTTSLESQEQTVKISGSAVPAGNLLRT